MAALDAEQRAAARIVDGPLIIIAGPGTGKTRTLTHRIAHLIADHKIAAEHCLAVTFTRRAAEELSERLGSLVPEHAAQVHVHTFHSFGLALLRENFARADLPADFQLALEGQRSSLLMEALGVRRSRAHRLVRQISRMKRSLEAAEPGSELEQAARAYQRHLRARGQVDFDDLIALPVALLRQDPELRQRYQQRYRYVAIDEFQDIDAIQYDLVRLLAPPGSHLCAIGDPDQAIYGFRGAQASSFAKFQGHYPTAEMVFLSRNYRSGPVIVEASRQMISRSSLVPMRRLQAVGDDARRLVLREAPTEQAEAEYVVHTIEHSLGGYSFFSLDSGRVPSGEGGDLSFSDFAILYRSKRQVPALVEALGRSGIPFQVRAHTRLGEQALVARLVESLPEDEKSVPELLEQAAQSLARRCKGEVSQPELGCAVDMLRPFAQRAGADRGSFLRDVAMSAEIDLWDPRADRVSLLTLHAAKGLEFEVVFVVGCEDGILPHRFSTEQASDPDEERRLLYVGMTRAKRALFVSYARRRRWRGQVRDQEPSPFLRDVEDRLLAREKSDRRKKPPQSTQLDLWR